MFFLLRVCACVSNVHRNECGVEQKFSQAVCTVGNASLSSPHISSKMFSYLRTLCRVQVNMALCVSQLSAAIFTPFFVAWGGEKPSFAFFPAAFLAATAAFFGLWMDEGKAAAAYVSTPLDDGGYRRSSVRSSTQYGGGGYVRSAAAATNGATSMDNQSDEASFSPRGRARLNESRHAYNRLPLQEDVEGEVDESGRRVHRPTEGTSRPLDQSDLEGGYIAPSAADVLAAPQ